MYLVDVASSGDAAKISQLRRMTLPASREFSLHDIRKVDWSDLDESSVVLVIRENGDIVASMRMIIFSNAASAERFLEYPVTPYSVQGPILVMSRAVTLPSHSNKGLMGAIRYAYLRSVLKTTIESIVAIVYQGAPRVNSMRRAGFELMECSGHWDSEAKVTALPLIGVLRKTLFAKALANTHSDFEQLINGCAFNWEAIDKRFAQAPVLSN